MPVPIRSPSRPRPRHPSFTNTPTPYPPPPLAPAPQPLPSPRTGSTARPRDLPALSRTRGSSQGHSPGRDCCPHPKAGVHIPLQWHPDLWMDAHRQASVSPCQAPPTPLHGALQLPFLPSPRGSGPAPSPAAPTAARAAAGPPRHQAVCTAPAGRKAGRLLAPRGPRGGVVLTRLCCQEGSLAAGIPRRPSSGPAAGLSVQ